MFLILDEYLYLNPEWSHLVNDIFYKTEYDQYNNIFVKADTVELAKENY